MKMMILAAIAVLSLGAGSANAGWVGKDTPAHNNADQFNNMRGGGG